MSSNHPSNERWVFQAKVPAVVLVPPDNEQANFVFCIVEPSGSPDPRPKETQRSRACKLQPNPARKGTAQSRESDGRPVAKVAFSHINYSDLQKLRP